MKQEKIYLTSSIENIIDLDKYLKGILKLSLNFYTNTILHSKVSRFSIKYKNINNLYLKHKFINYKAPFPSIDEILESKLFLISYDDFIFICFAIGYLAFINYDKDILSIFYIHSIDIEEISSAYIDELEKRQSNIINNALINKDKELLNKLIFDNQYEIENKMLLYGVNVFMKSMESINQNVYNRFILMFDKEFEEQYFNNKLEIEYSQKECIFFVKRIISEIIFNYRCLFY